MKLVFSAIFCGVDLRGRHPYLGAFTMDEANRFTANSRIVALERSFNHISTSGMEVKEILPSCFSSNDRKKTPESRSRETHLSSGMEFKAL
jgi:hypothetical protein